MTADDVLTGVSPALLGYCFADQLVAAARMKVTGVTPPCRDVAVKADELAGTLFALAFWNLRRQGLLTLDLAQKKRLGLFSASVLMASPSGTDKSAGLEGAVLANLGHGARPVRDVIRDWYRRDVLHPAQEVVNVVLREGVAAGCLAEVDAGRGTLGKLLLGKTHLEPDCARIAGLAGTFAAFKDSWEQFRATETVLAKALVETCELAVISRLDTTTAADYS